MFVKQKTIQIQGFLKLTSDKAFEPPSSLRALRKTGIFADFVSLAVRFSERGKHGPTLRQPWVQICLFMKRTYVYVCSYTNKVQGNV